MNAHDFAVWFLDWPAPALPIFGMVVLFIMLWSGKIKTPEHKDMGIAVVIGLSVLIDFVFIAIKHYT
jgi:hypothetical protein